MTDLPTTYTPPRASVVAGANPMALVPTDLDGLGRLAAMIYNSGMAPKDMRNVESVGVAILAGMEIGLTPMQSVQSIAVVNGRPTVWGDAAKALVIGHPSCEDIIERATGDGDAIIATCIAKRKGRAPVERSFSVADAKKADLWGKAGPWRQYPSRMLQLRARAFALRDAFPDVLKGIGIREEQEDVAAMKDVTPPRKTDDLPPPPPTINAQVSQAQTTWPMNGGEADRSDEAAPAEQEAADEAREAEQATAEPPEGPDPDSWAEAPEDFVEQAKAIREAIEGAKDLGDLTTILDTWADRVSEMPADIRAELRGVAKAVTAKLKGTA